MSAKVQEKVVSHVIDRALSEERLPWHRPWQQCQIGLSKNLKTKHAYSGINTFTLMHETRSAYFLTYKQAQELGGQVRKGSKGSPIVFYSTAEKKETNAAGEKQYFRFLKYSTVFSAADIDGVEIPADEQPLVLAAHQRIECAETVAAGYIDGPAVIEDSKQAHAFYRPSVDEVHMPALGAFDSAESYYSVLFHEFIHSTGAKRRLDRDLSGGMRSDSYSKEELVAELGACLLRAHCQIDLPEIENNSVAYLQGWVSKLQDKPAMFTYAAAKATTAVNHILNTETE